MIFMGVGGFKSEVRLLYEVKVLVHEDIVRWVSFNYAACSSSFAGLPSR